MSVYRTIGPLVNLLVKIDSEPICLILWGQLFKISDVIGKRFVKISDGNITHTLLLAYVVGINLMS